MAEASELRAEVNGIGVDAQTRCAAYYACKDCHDALAGHAIEVWPRSEWDQPAVLCGACGTELTIAQYLDCANDCPACAASFNPGCRNHYRFYFEAM
jgi:uncharacterized CHY-type Zn-finger protein